MKNARQIGIVALIIMVLGITWTAGAVAAPAESFYKGKKIKLWIGSNPGGGYDTYSRLLARHLGRHIPGNPSIIPVNKPGASSLIASNALYNQAKPDGLTFLAINHSVIVGQLLGDPKVRLDVLKMPWIGSISGSPNVCIIRNGARYQKIDDIIGAKEPTILAATARSSRENYSKMLVEVLGANFKIITGYQSGGSIYVAIESGEADGSCGVGWDSIQARLPQWKKDKSVSVFFQIDPSGKIPELPDVPWIMDYVKTQDERDLINAGMATQAIVRSYVAPPGVPEDRMTILKKAFTATLKDPKFLKDADRMNLPIKPKTASEVVALIKGLFNIRPQLLDKIRNIYFPAGF